MVHQGFTMFTVLGPSVGRDPRRQVGQVLCNLPRHRSRVDGGAGAETWEPTRLEQSGKGGGISELTEHLWGDGDSDSQLSSS
jgi:hypothetical protein